MLKTRQPYVPARVQSSPSHFVSAAAGSSNVLNERFASRRGARVRTTTHGRRPRTDRIDA